MRVVIIGAAGQLGTDLAKLLPDAHQLTHADIDITDAGRVHAVLTPLRPDVVINTAAYNLVDQAEDDPELAFSVNERGAAHLANWTHSTGGTLLHVSTDYVFGGDVTRNRPYTETDTPQPVGVYGQSKLAGEMAVQAATSRHFIVRTCGLYGQVATRAKGNFVKTMLRLAGERSELKIISDQRCTPSYTHDVAAAIADLITTDQFGLYHVTNAGTASWYELACEVFRLAGKDVSVKPIPSSEYPTRAKRPAYSVLDCSKLEQVIGRAMPDWQDALRRYLKETGQL